MIDLHTHSTASDGTVAPADLVFKARMAGLAGLALTDHDTVDGLGEAMDAAREHGVTLVRGVEVSAASEVGSLHILGLHVDPLNPALKSALAWVVDMRNRRNLQMAARLTDLGLPTRVEEVAKMSSGSVIGRPHFAAFMIQKKYAKTMKQAFEKHIGNGRPAYVPKQKLTAQRAIDVIRQAGGVPVLAHPDQTGLDGEKLYLFTRGLAECGLAGMEVYYPGYSSARIKAYIRIAERLDLVLSGGSDFHGDNKPRIALGVGSGKLRVPDALLGPLAERSALIMEKATRERVGIEPT